MMISIHHSLKLKRKNQRMDAVNPFFFKQPKKKEKWEEGTRDTVERRFIRNIIEQQYAHGSSVISYIREKIKDKTQCQMSLYSKFMHD